MSTSDFNMTRDEIIARALRIVGAIQESETPSAIKVTNAALALNALVKTMSNKGIRLWETSEDSVSTVAAQNYKNLDSDTLDISNVTINGIQLPLMSQGDWDLIYDKTIQSLPSSAYYYKGLIHQIYFYPIPDAVYTVKFRKTKRTYDFDASSDNPDFPIEWIDCLVFGLAYRLSHEYHLPLEERNSLRNEFLREFEEAKGNTDRERVDFEFTTGAYD